MTIVEAPPIACTLAPGAFKDRLAWIAALNKDALRKYERRDLVLELSYALEARERVHEMVRNERTCCAFLAFELHEAGNEIRLTVTAPETAREAADTLFEQFVANAPAPSSCACATSASVVKTASKGAAGFEGRRRHGHDAFNRRSCLWRMLRLAVCTAGDDSRQYRILVGVVGQNACVGHHPRHPLGRRRMGLDRVADAPHASQAGQIDALHDGGGDNVIGGRRAMAAA